MRLRLLPLVDLDAANAAVLHFHRHHDPIERHKFSLGVLDELGGVRGVAIVGTPAARMLDDDYTFEVRRLATDGTKNACSLLYAAALRMLAAGGARRALTYTLASEPGTSLVATGWYLATPQLEPAATREEATVKAASWCRAGRKNPREADLFGDRPRQAAVEEEDKLRWAVRLDGSRRRRR